MAWRQEPDRPRDVELWVTTPAWGRYCARKMSGAYKADLSSAVKSLERYPDSRWPDDWNIETVEVNNDE